jgi:hypothetical protein
MKGAMRMDARDLAGILTKAGAAVIVMMPNLDNGIMNYTGISNAERGGCKDMSKQFKGIRGKGYEASK